ncbi:NAD(P)H-dependent oxidoreductase [Agrococcus sp. ARC_14]|uniref:NAD(P)H-dependent oxidoreductase n=1 Tax=Agrococcus sp. ARC_14 TaxID=2919927 RepID=UPI001F06ABF6|nr:NAD(P)H-dependent oxidoreductase [Agrococcus sp. ARC_14]MCH1884113.1 NAD(P)H-dependent oxidoreductase [Agrococcus sp. ARC_14]
MTPRETVLWISAHPEPRSLTGSLREQGIAHLRERGHEVIESDLYAMAWDPVLRPSDTTSGRFSVTADTRRDYLEGTQPGDVAAEQEKLRRASAVVLQFPLWWYGMPAIMKGWLDRVLVSGFAFGTDEATGRRLRFEQGQFVGTRALVATTLGDRAASIGPRGKSGELEQLLFGLLHGTLAYTGMSVLEPWALPSADFTDTEDDPFLGLRDRLDGLFSDDPIPYRPQFTGDYSSEWALLPHIRPGETSLDVHVVR